MSTDSSADLSRLLAAYFYDDRYRDGVERLRADIKAYPGTAQRWRELVDQVKGRKLAEGGALRVVQEEANRVLDDNTDDEAYRWLDLLIENVSREGGEIDEY